MGKKLIIISEKKRTQEKKMKLFVTLELDESTPYFFLKK